MTKQYENQDRGRAFLFGDGQSKVTWLLANPTERGIAVGLNAVLTGLAFAPLGKEIYHQHLKGTDWGFRTLGLHIWEYLGAVIASDAIMGKVGLLVFVLYLALQMALMSLSGQSLGKKLVGIRVIEIKSREAGFFHVVLLRELVFHLVCILLIGMLLMLLRLNDNFGAISLLWLPYLFFLSNLADEKDNCQTWQDKLASTAVVKAKPVIRPY